MIGITVDDFLEAGFVEEFVGAFLQEDFDGGAAGGFGFINREAAFAVGDPEVAFVLAALWERTSTLSATMKAE